MVEKIVKLFENNSRNMFCAQVSKTSLLIDCFCPLDHRSNVPDPLGSVTFVLSGSKSVRTFYGSGSCLFCRISCLQLKIIILTYIYSLWSRSFACMRIFFISNVFFLLLSMLQSLGDGKDPNLLSPDTDPRILIHKNCTDPEYWIRATVGWSSCNLDLPVSLKEKNCMFRLANLLQM